jgi:hypothetical protein
VNHKQLQWGFVQSNGVFKPGQISCYSLFTHQKWRPFLTQTRRIFKGTINWKKKPRSNIALKGDSPGELGLGPDPGVREERVGPQQLLIPGRWSTPSNSSLNKSLIFKIVQTVRLQREKIPQALARLQASQYVHTLSL